MTKSKTNLISTVAIASILAAACSPPSQPPTSSDNQAERGGLDGGALGGPVTSQELDRILRGQNPTVVSDALNRAKARGLDRGALDALFSCWNSARLDCSGMDDGVRQDALVRLDVSDILVQAYFNHELSEVPDGAHKFQVSALQGEDLRLAGRAAISLSVFDSPEDVPMLESAAQRGGSPLFKQAVIALARMCPIQAQQALDRIAGKANSSDKEFILSVMQQSAEMKQRSGACRVANGV